jgi:hypothetical protein
MAADSDPGSRSDLELSLQLDADLDSEEVERLTSSLRSELLALDVDDVARPSAGPAPAGAKAVDALALGALVVRLAARRELLAGVVGAVRTFLGARGGRTVKLAIDGDVLEVTGVSSSQQDRLIEAWVERQAGR